METLSLLVVDLDIGGELYSNGMYRYPLPETLALSNIVKYIKREAFTCCRKMLWFGLKFRAISVGLSTSTTKDEDLYNGGKGCKEAVIVQIS